MRKLYDVTKQQSVTHAAKQMAIEHNVTFNVIDIDTGKIVQSHEGHNAATNTLLTGIAHYLAGDGVYNQAYDMLSMYLPRYISLGTMGLFTQASDENGNQLYYGDPETERLCHYIMQCPGFGADGYDVSQNNDRPYLGLGPKYDDRPFSETAYCELINDSFPRTAISLRDIVPEYQAEVPKTIDIIYSGMISTGALAQFRGTDETTLQTNSYLFITEAGLWSSSAWSSGGNNGLLAGYRIVPPNQTNWDLGTYIEGHYADLDDPNSEWVPAHFDLDANTYKVDDDGNFVKDYEGNLIPDENGKAYSEFQKENQEILRKNILRVNKNQVVQVIWKIQIGGLEQLGGMSELYPSVENSLVWQLWDEQS